MVSINFSNITVLNINGADYRCVINGISKRQAVKLQQKADLNQKS